jgi:hypothetical protein
LTQKKELEQFVKVKELEFTHNWMVLIFCSYGNFVKYWVLM